MTPGEAQPPARTPGLAEFADLVASLAASHRMVPVEGRRTLLAEGASGEVAFRLHLPTLAPLPRSPFEAGAYAEDLLKPHGPILLLLLQAGACAMGLWTEGRLTRHKVIKKYVVRGTGRSQTTYLKTRGKSRYGSRLRLRNAAALLGETNAKLADLHREEGPFERVFASCPVRLWHDLCRADPPPPFPARGFHEKVPLDVRVPSFEELKRVWWNLSHGRVEAGGERGTEPPPPA